MSDSSAPAPAGSPDASVSDLRSIANDMPMGAFGFEDEEKGDQGGESGDAARSDAQGQEPAPREEGQRRDLATGRFAARDGQSDGGAEGDAQEQPEAQGKAQPGEEGQGEPPEGEAPQEEPEAPEGEPKRLDFMEIDGVRHSAEDIRRSFMRQEDYSRKTGELGRERQTVQQHAERLQSYETQLVDVLDTTVAALRETLPPQPDPGLLDTDPVAYHKQAIAHANAVQKLQSIAGQRDQMSQTQQARHQQQSQQHTERQQHAVAQHQQEQIRLVQEKLPELRTPEGERAFFEKASKYAGHYGLTQDELLKATVQDHRIALVLQDAMLGHEVRTKRPQTTERLKAAPPIRQQARPAAGTRDGQARREANAAFVKNPTMKTALDTGVLDDVFADIP